jgi:hypothetical protein
MLCTLKYILRFLIIQLKIIDDEGEGEEEGE